MRAVMPERSRPSGLGTLITTRNSRPSVLAATPTSETRPRNGCRPSNPDTSTSTSLPGASRPHQPVRQAQLDRHQAGIGKAQHALASADRDARIDIARQHHAIFGRHQPRIPKILLRLVQLGLGSLPVRFGDIQFLLGNGIGRAQLAKTFEGLARQFRLAREPSSKHW